MAQSQKRFRRSRKDDDDAQQFVLTERDRELAALAAEILPRNSAAASFERHAARNAGSTSVSAKDAVTDHELLDDDAPAPRAHGTSDKASAKATGTTAADADAVTGTDDVPSPAATNGTKSAGRKKRSGKNSRKGAGSAGATARTGAAASSTSTAGEASKNGKATGAAGTASGAETAAEPAEETPAELKARRKRELAAKRREEKAAKAEERERRALDYQPTPTWYKVIMVGLMIVALLWIISYYLFQGLIPIPGIGVWNLVIGLAFMLTGLIMTTRWR